MKHFVNIKVQAEDNPNKIMEVLTEVEADNLNDAVIKAAVNIPKEIK